MQPLTREVCGKIDKYEKAAASEAKKHMAVLRNDHIFAFGWLFKTSLTFSMYAVFTLLTLYCTWPIVPKACGTPNRNARVSSKVIEMRSRHTLQIHTPSM